LDKDNLGGIYRGVFYLAEKMFCTILSYPYMYKRRENSVTVDITGFVGF
jgi:hypothetical protein